MIGERRAPWFKLYGTDWRADPGLRMCGLAARGLWFDMLTLMHEADPYGHLLIGGVAPSPGELARILGEDASEVAWLLTLLEERQVFSRTRTGTIYSRRMVRDNARDSERQAAGRRYGLLGGNPALPRGVAPKDERVRRFRPSDSPVKARRIFDRCGGRCHWCHDTLPPAHDGPSRFHIDHLIRVRDGGTNDDGNLVAVCAECIQRQSPANGGSTAESDPNPADARNPTLTPPKSDPNPPPNPTLTRTASDPNPPHARFGAFRLPRGINTSSHNTLSEDRIRTGPNTDPNGRKVSDPNPQKPEARKKESSSSFFQSSRVHAPAPARGQRMPTLNDKPAAWMALADKGEVDKWGVERPVVGGHYLDGVAFDVCQAARIDGHVGGVDWMPLAGLLRAGYDPEERILPAIRRCAARPNYQPPKSLKYFENIVREYRPAP